MLHRSIPGLAAFAAFVCGTLLFATPVVAETVKGNGVVRTQPRTASGFTDIGLGLDGRVELRQGDTEALTVEADENLLPLIETRVKDGSLEIRPVRRGLRLESKTIKVIVQARRIDSLAVGGSGSITAGALHATKLSLDIGGSGRIDLARVQAESVKAAIGGSGDIRLAGAATRLEVSIGGSGSALAAGLVADEAQVSLAGSGNAQVAVRRKLDVTIAGTGSVSYAGDPEVNQTIVGVGRVKRMGPLPH